MEENINVSEMKHIFESKLKKIQKNDFLTYDRYLQLIEEVKEAKKKKFKSDQDYNQIEEYDVLEYGDTKKLITPISETSGKILYYIHEKNIFDVLHASHIGSGHGGPKRMETYLRAKYKNITNDIILLYLSFCKVCQTRRANRNKESDDIEEPLILNNMTRGSIDIFDMQNCKDGDYNFILVYQDFFTKFICLKPLKTISPEEVAHNLMDVFCLFGIPSILHSYHSEFTKNIINVLQEMWNGLKIVPGNSHVCNSGSVERTYQDIRTVLKAWMLENNTTHWSEGLKYCQFRKNNILNKEMKQTPFKAMFGRKASNGFVSTTIPFDVIASINSEDDLEKVISEIKKSKEISKKVADPVPKGSGPIAIIQCKRAKLEEPSGSSKKCTIKLNLNKTKTPYKLKIISHNKTELNGIPEANHNFVLKTEEIDIKNELIEDDAYSDQQNLPQLDKDPSFETVKVEPCDDYSYRLEDLVDESL